MMVEELSFKTVDSAHAPSGFKRGDVVKLYKEGTELSFPCIVLSCDKLEMYRVDALKGVLGNRSLLVTEDLYNVYVEMENAMVLIGSIPSTRLKYILGSRIFRPFRKRVHLSPQETIEGDLLYALCVNEAQ